MLALVAALLLAVGAGAENLATFQLLHDSDHRSAIFPTLSIDPGTESAQQCTLAELTDAPLRCLGGPARKKAYLDSVRLPGNRSVLVTTGDALSAASLYYRVFRGSATADVVNALGYDLVGIDAGDFVEGSIGLSAFLNRLDAQAVSSNVRLPLSNPVSARVADYVVRELADSVRVAFVGFSPEDLVETSNAGIEVTVEDIVATLNSTVERVRADEGVELIVAFGNVFLPKAREIATSVSGIDVVVHSNREIPFPFDYPIIEEGVDGQPVAIVSSGGWHSYLGVLNVTVDVDAGRLVSAAGHVQMLNVSDPLVGEDPALRAMQEGWFQSIEALYAAIIGVTETGFSGTECRETSCTAGLLLTDAVRDNTGTQITIINGGGIRGSTPPGNISIAQIDSMFPFFNLVSRFDLQGRFVKSSLENSVSTYGDDSNTGRFAQVSGLRFAFDPEAPPGERVLNVQIEAAPGVFEDLSPVNLYTVSTWDFIRRGNDGYTDFLNEALNVDDFGDLVSDVVADFVERYDGPLNYVVDDRIFVDPGGVITGGTLDSTGDGSGAAGATPGSDAGAGSGSGSDSDSLVIIIGASLGGLILIIGVLFVRSHYSAKVGAHPASGAAIEIGDLKMGQVLGTGAYGTVYGAYWRDTEVAVKVLDKAADKNLVDFRTELALLSNLRHPNVVLFMGYSVTLDGKPMLVTELMRLGSLGDVIMEKGFVMPEQLRLRVSSEAARGMSYLHQHRPPVLHRDLKAANLLVDENWSIKVADFGLSAIHGDGAKEVSGTLLWTAPEVLDGSKSSPASDVYSFGITMWELLEQSLPYAGRPVWATLVGIREMGLRPKVTKLKATPDYLAIMSSCWSATPEQRPTFSAITTRLTAAVQAAEAPFLASPPSTSSADGAGSGGVPTITTVSASGMGRMSIGGMYQSMSSILFNRVPPEGNITAVFTDILGSTALWEDEPEATFAALNKHNELIMGLLRQFNGYEVSADGDAFFVVFDQAIEAIAFCVAVQEELLEIDWPEALLRHPMCEEVLSKDGKRVIFRGLRVRMGMHCGEPRMQSNAVTGRADYFGPVINRAARTSGTADGGQIVISDACYEQAGDQLRLNSNLSVRSLGSTSLKGVPEEVELFEVMPRSLRERTAVLGQSLKLQSEGRASPTGSSKDSSALPAVLKSAGDGFQRFRVQASEIELGAQIGRGSYGQVFHGKLRGSPIAVKQFFNRKMGTQLLTQVRLEVAIFVRMDHPNLVKIHGLSADPPSLLMEFVKGQSLGALLDTPRLHGSLTAKACISILTDIGRGLEYLHAQVPPVVHRDLTPSNILLSEDDWAAKLTDFGLQSVKDSASSMTTTDNAAYQAPEVFENSEITDKADVYSLAIVAFEMVHRRPAFPGKLPLEVAAIVRRKERPAIDKGVPRAIAALIAKAWEAAPKDRPAVGSLLAELAAE